MVRRRATVLLPLLPVLFTALGACACACAQEAHCLPYEPDEVTVDGVLRLTLQPGPPHYRSVEAGDVPEPVWMLTPDHTLCMEGIAGDDWSVALNGITQIEVRPRAALASQWNGQRAHVSGVLARPRVGHPRSPVVLQAARPEAMSLP